MKHHGILFQVTEHYPKYRILRIYYFLVFCWELPINMLVNSTVKPSVHCSLFIVHMILLINFLLSATFISFTLAYRSNVSLNVLCGFVSISSNSDTFHLITAFITEKIKVFRFSSCSLFVQNYSNYYAQLFVFSISIHVL